MTAGGDVVESVEDAGETFEKVYAKAFVVCGEEGGSDELEKCLEERLMMMMVRIGKIEIGEASN